MAAPDKLDRYKAKRNFAITSEPAEGGDEGSEALSFVVQKHWASSLHYDFRLELGGVMLSWAVPKGPSYDTADKRMAVHVEDHPISYSSFEGEIPAKQYGAGKVIIWDKGTWHPIGDPEQGYRDGNLKFELHGHKLLGKWALIRIKNRQSSKQEAWLLIKEKDGYMKPAAEFSVVDEYPDSVASLPAPTSAAASPKPAPAAAEAPKAELPAKLSPQLATLVEGPPRDPENWVYEIKFDGYRLLARVDGKSIQLFTRNGNDWTKKLASLHATLKKMKLLRGWYDGEIVVLNDKGVPDFGALQNAFDAESTADIVFFVFDAPYLDGRDLRGLPLDSRREQLQQVLAERPSEQVRFSDVFDAPPQSIVASACQIGLEGVIAKRRDSVYRSSRSADWIKLKCSHRQEFVIAGWTDPKGSRSGIGALVLGVHDEDGKLVYAGNVGTGFNSRSLEEIRARLDEVPATKSPFAAKVAMVGKPHWVEPVLVAEVTFGEWTSSGHIRHSVFHGLRTDKPASEIVREKAASAPKKTKAKAQPVARPAEASHALSTRLRVTNPERVIDTSTGITKVELVRYYALVGELMMEHLHDRPVSLVRAPAGVGGQLFFQKHAETEKLPGIRQLDPALYASHPPMLEVESPQGLLSAAQWNVVEFHTLNTVASSFEFPDRLVFDLDPGEGVAWSEVKKGAELMHVFLEQLGLPGFLKTSGGKGLHVVVPIKRQHDWDSAKGFAQAVVQHMAQTLPQLFVAKSGPKNRVGKIFIDYLRNGLGATTACAWSARARPGLGISVPVGWDELGKLKGGDHWTIRSAQTRLDKGNEPWAGYAKATKALTKAMKLIGYQA
ncbi:DNA ligase D [Xylophilus rhododendri]|uniref:DNA ligase (ATP) n=1 Tax=Xylophilus rhododendri TaxID=2697032 RepID=A0A857JC04_9BURK|nr:DNA ligase D [Xylophilus rhododendri]QHJ00226.1 DNA ligase D [Xylophilus rhododendri]